jgi:hypothetical protein
MGPSTLRSSTETRSPVAASIVTRAVSLPAWIEIGAQFAALTM